MKDGSARNDLFDRLSGSDGVGLPLDELRATVDPRAFVGRAPEQVEEFLEEIVEPLLAKEPHRAVLADEVRV